jgi:hypothetical protein
MGKRGRNSCREPQTKSAARQHDTLKIHAGVVCENMHGLRAQDARFAKVARASENMHAARSCTLRRASCPCPPRTQHPENTTHLEGLMGKIDFL